MASNASTNTKGPPGLVWRGVWSGATNYIVNDAVSRGGGAWIAIQAGTNKDPSQEPTYWEVLAEKGDLGSGGFLAQGFAGDSYVLHRWLLSDASAPFADTGSAADAAMAVQAGAPIPGRIGWYSDALEMSVSTDYLASSDDVGLPTSTTDITIDGWICPWVLSGYVFLAGKYVNPTRANPYDSIALIAAGTKTWLQWTDANGTFHNNAGVDNTVVAALGSWVFWHLGATISIVNGVATVKMYSQGKIVTTQTVNSAAIKWNSGSSGAWVLGGRNRLNDGGCAGLFYDWMIHDGIARPASYFKDTFKAGRGLVY